jgi:hypothetical protein
MSHYEICINVHLNKVYGPNTQGCVLDSILPSDPGESMLYGILPDQAAVDAVMVKLCEVGIQLVLANTRSPMVSEVAEDLKNAFGPEMVHLN